MTTPNHLLQAQRVTTTTIQAAVRCLRARETVEAHRHTSTAIRFVLGGAGAYTTVNGVKCHMSAGDFILIPSWSWHDHTNPTDGLMSCLDGLDTPLVTRLGSDAYEDHAEGRQTPTRGASSLLRQPWDVTDRALSRLFRDPTRIASAEFTDPSSGGPICPTFDCWMHRLGPALTGPPTRKTGNSIFVAFNGTGTTSIGAGSFEWAAGDIFVVPPWTAVRHHPIELSDLFELTDRPALKALGLYRQEPLT